MDHLRFNRLRTRFYLGRRHIHTGAGWRCSQHSLTQLEDHVLSASGKSPTRNVSLMMHQPLQSLAQRLFGKDGWRTNLLLALPLGSVAFLLGIWLDPLSGQGNPFDRVVYPILAVTLAALEVVLWRYRHSTQAVLTAVVLISSGFFLSKLIYLLFFAPPALSVQAEMTESFFWIPAVYVISLFIPSRGAARNTTLIFFGSMMLCSVIYTVTFGWTLQTSGVIYALMEMLLAHLILVGATLAFIGHKKRLDCAGVEAQTLRRMVYTDLLTGLPSRLRLDQELGEAIARGETFTVLFIDIDSFKLVNDTLGHSRCSRNLPTACA